ncbi:MAG TPA: hypothetical protein VI542_31935, partial [Candidatus Tectomicrobia bacterium]
LVRRCWAMCFTILVEDLLPRHRVSTCASIASVSGVLGVQEQKTTILWEALYLLVLTQRNRCVSSAGNTNGKGVDENPV